MCHLLLLVSLLGLTHANPPTSTPDNPQTITVAKPWYGWMIVDAANHKIVFLPIENKLALNEGIVVNGVPTSKGAYMFSVPYSSEFVGVAIDPRGNISALKRIAADCLQAFQPAGIPDDRDGRHLKVAAALGVTGPLLKAYVAPNVPMQYVGPCQAQVAK